MAGVRLEGILQVDDVGTGGAGVSVDIVTPLGSQLAADSVSVTLATDQSTIPVSPSPIVVTASGTITTPGQEVSIDVTGLSVVGIDIQGGASYSLLCKGLVAAGIIETDVPMNQVVGGMYDAPYITNTGNGRFVANVAGLKTFKLVCDSIGSGTITISMEASNAPLPLNMPVTLFNPYTGEFAYVTAGSLHTVGPLTDAELRATPIPISGTVDQGTPAVVANGWPAKLTNGTDTADIRTANEGLTNAIQGLVTQSVMFKRNEDSSVDSWTGMGAVNNGHALPGVRALRTIRSEGPTTLNYLGAQLNIAVHTYQVESVVVVILAGNLIGEISFLTTPGTSLGVIEKIYNATTDRWVNGIINDFSADAVYYVPIAGLANLFARVSSYTSGSVIGYWAGGPGDAVLYTYSKVSNGSSTDAVNIQDGGNSITVDGAVTTDGLTDAELRATPVNINPTTRDGDVSDTNTPLFPIAGKLNATGTLHVVQIENVAANNSDWGLVTRQVGMPDAATLADNVANPTLTKIQTFPSWYDGSTWDRAKGDSTNGLLVDLGTNNDVTINNPGLTDTELRATPVPISGTVDTELPSAASLTDSIANPTVPAVGAFGMIWNSGTSQWQRQRTATFSSNYLTGVTASGMMGSFDDSAPSATVEDSLGNLRMSSRRELYNQIRDAAGNERGANVNASNQLEVSITEPKSSVATETQVADNAASVTILAANALRLGASIVNDSSAALYLRLSATAATITAYTVKLVSGAYYEVPFRYTGEIVGIWATDPNDGAARVTEFTV